MRACLILFIIVLVFASFPCESRQHGEARAIEIGILAHRGETTALKRWQPTAQYISEKLNGAPVVLSALTLAGVKAALDRGDIDFLLTNPGHFQLLVDSYSLSPIATLRTERDDAARTGNRFGAVIFVRADNASIGGIADIKGKSLAAVAPDAFGGFQIAALTMLRNGIDPWADLSRIQYIGFPQDRIVDAVLRGEADVGTVRTGLIENLVRNWKLESGAIRILNPQRIPDFDLLLSTGVFPEWTFAATQNTDERIRKAVALALLELPENHDAAVAGEYGGWTAYMRSPSVLKLLNLVEEHRARVGYFKSDLPYFMVWVLGGLAAVAIMVARVRGLRARQEQGFAGPSLTRRERERFLPLSRRG